MGPIQNFVHYCCVAKGNRILYTYSGGDHEMNNLALLCLERTPPFHKWYFETTGKRTFCFLIEDGYVYFLITDENVRNPKILQFVEQFRDEFKKLARKGSKGNSLSTSSVHVQEQLVPVVRRLIASLEKASRESNDAWIGEIHSLHANHTGLSPSPASNANGQVEVSSSTKAPLLGKSSKQEKRKTKDHVIGIIDGGLEEHRKSGDRGANCASTSTVLDSSTQSGSSSLIPQQEDSGSTRMRSASQSIQKKWWSQVRIVLAIDAVVCLVLFVIWLGVCRGINCIR